MSTKPNGERLADKRNVTLILRLVLDRDGKLMHGELVDVGGKVQTRFIRWRELTRTVRAWLVSQV